MELHLENEVAWRVASDHHRSNARSIAAPPHFHRHVREFLNQHLPQYFSVFFLVCFASVCDTYQ